MDQPGLLVAAINISEGRRIRVVDQIAQTVGGGSRLLDLHSDPDHNRSVMTVAGHPSDIETAAVGIAEASIDLIDITKHVGVHPRLGAVDVIPFVPARGSSLDDCVRTARSLGLRLANDLDLPCFFYDLASDRGRPLPDVRRLAFDTLPPDVGPPGPHPTAGATCIGARGPMVAFNVELEGDDLALAKRIASSLRKGEGPLSGIRALAFNLSSRGCVQVSMNLLEPMATTPAAALAEVERLANLGGLGVRSAELVGLAPKGALLGLEKDLLRGPKASLEEALEGAFGPAA